MHFTPTLSPWHPFFFTPKATLSTVPPCLPAPPPCPRVLSRVCAVRSVGCVPEEAVETAAGQGPRCEGTQVAGP